MGKGTMYSTMFCSPLGSGGGTPRERAPDIWEKYRDGSVSIALIASDGRGHAILIDMIGPDIEYWLVGEEQNVGEVIQEFSDAPAGIHLWVGRVVQSGGREGDLYAERLQGVYRTPTEDEWAKYLLEGVMWDEASYLLESTRAPTGFPSAGGKDFN